MGAIWRYRWPFLLNIGGAARGASPAGCIWTLRVSKVEGEIGMELEAVVRQVMERSFEASVREDTWSFADHALVETLIALMFSRLQRLRAEQCSEASLQRDDCE
jgi:hypothetical protein